MALEDFLALRVLESALPMVVNDKVKRTGHGEAAISDKQCHIRHTGTMWKHSRFGLAQEVFIFSIALFAVNSGPNPSG